MGRKKKTAKCAVVPDKVLEKNMKRLICRMLPFVIVFIIIACAASQSEQGSERQTQASSTAKVDGEAQPEPVIIRMSDYSGFEKVGALGKKELDELMI